MGCLKRLTGYMLAIEIQIEVVIEIGFFDKSENCFHSSLTTNHSSLLALPDYDYFIRS